MPKGTNSDEWVDLEIELPEELLETLTDQAARSGHTVEALVVLYLWETARERDRCKD